MFDFSTFALPISILLGVFGVYLLLYIIFSFFNLYHLMRYGVYGFGLYLIVTIYASGTILLATGSYFLLSEYNWNAPISFEGFFNLNATESLNELKENVFPSL